MSIEYRSEPTEPYAHRTRLRATAALALTGLMFLMGGCSSDVADGALPTVDEQDRTASALPSDPTPGEVTDAAYGDDGGTSPSTADQERIAEAVSALAGLATVDWTTEQRNAHANTDALELPEDQLDELIDSYQQFLAARNDVRLGSSEALAQLRTLATDPVVRQAELWRDQNNELEDLGAHIGYIGSYPNALIIAGDDQQVTINDCLEERIGSATMLLGATNYLDQIVTFTRRDDGWLVTSVDIRHDGTVDEDRPGCIPALHALEVERVVAEYLTAVDRLWNSPNTGAESLAQLASEQIQASVEKVLTALVEAGAHVAQPQLHQITAIGSDPTYGNAWFLAEVCTSLPEGLSPSYLDSGQPIPPADGGYEIPAGVSTLREVLVLLEADDNGDISGTVSRITNDDLNSDCDKD